MTRAVYVVEHKTTSEDIELGSQYWQMLTLNDQISTYLEGVKQIGFQPRGMVYDVIRKPGEKPYEVNTRRSVAEAPEEYGARILEKIGEDPNKYFRRGVIVRIGNEAHIAAQNAWLYSQQVIAFRKNENFPQNPGGCKAWNRLCEFWDVCAGNDRIDNTMRFTPPGLREKTGDDKKRLPLFSTTALSDLRQCPRLYQYKHEMGYRPLKKADSLHFGTLFHKALEAWWVGNGSLEAALLALSIRTTERHGKTYVIEVNDYDAAKARALIMGYHAKWSDTPMNVLGVEKEFAGPLVNPDTGGVSRTFVRGGVVDAIAEMEM